MPHIRPLQWQVAHHPSANAAPDRWVDAVVPGAVQLDWARAEGWEPYWKADNWKQYRWMEDAFWSYRSTVPEMHAGSQRAFLVLEGVDYRFDVLLAGVLVHSQEGMFTPATIELTGRCKPGDEIIIRIHPAPKSRREPENRDQANHSCKPAMSYEWDFHPRLIPLGIWQDAYIVSTPATWLQDAELRYTLSDDLSRAELELLVSADGTQAASVEWQLISPAGDVVVNTADRTATINSPALWWPHDHGAQNLYTLRVSCAQQTIEKRIGLRRVRLVMHDGAWKHPERFPKGPSNPPMTLEINGRQIFAKGSNFVSPAVFPGTLDEDQYRRQLTLARDLHMNIFRMWGGAPAQKPRFYQMADEMGIMVWQEFPLACNKYPDEAAYLEILDQESRSLIRRLRQHPCIVILCGGNELFNGWSGMTEQSHALRLLDRNCFDLAPELPFLKTSPIMGVGHGHYCFRDMQPAEEAWSIFQRSSCTAYTEFGVAGASPVDVLRRCKSPDAIAKLHTPQVGRRDLGELIHQQPGTIEHYFGKQQSLEAWCDLTHWLQGEGYRGIFEEARRQKPKCAMAINWCFNEPWPNLANLSLIAWPCEPKPSIKAVAAALRPALASARIPHFQWKPGELFEAELWLLSDRPDDCPAGEMTATLIIGDAEHPLLTWHFAQAAANQNVQGPRIQFRLPDVQADRLQLHLAVAGRPELDSTYILSFRPTPPASTARP